MTQYPARLLGWLLWKNAPEPSFSAVALALHLDPIEEVPGWQRFHGSCCCAEERDTGSKEIRTSARARAAG